MSNKGSENKRQIGCYVMMNAIDERLERAVAMYE